MQVQIEWKAIRKNDNDQLVWECGRETLHAPTEDHAKFMVKRVLDERDLLVRSMRVINRRELMTIEEYSRSKGYTPKMLNSWFRNRIGGKNILRPTDPMIPELIVQYEQHIDQLYRVAANFAQRKGKSDDCEKE